MNKNIINLISILSILWGFFFQYKHTIYFGSNFLPKTNEEIICDITGVILVLFGIIIKAKNK